MGGCCYACLKYLVMVFNLIYMLIGLALQGCMLWLYFDEQVYGNVAKDVDSYNWIIFILMGIGTVVTIMGFLGCCGALQESQCMLATFFGFVLILFASQVAVVGLLYEHRGRFKVTTEEEFKKAFQSQYTYNKVKTLAMDKMQKDLECCGAKDYEDWMCARFNIVQNNDAHYNQTCESSPKSINFGVGGDERKIPKYTVPQSCCKEQFMQVCDATRQTNEAKLKDYINTEGCATKIFNKIEENTTIIYITLFVIAFIELLAMIFSLVLCCTARKIDQYKA